MVDFKLFDAETAGNQVGATISSTITPVDGVFSESLDFGASAHEANQALWLEITVDGTALSRQRLEAAPYALNTRGINVEEISDGTNAVTIPEGKLRVELRPLLDFTPSGSFLELGKFLGRPGIGISRGDGSNGVEQQYYSFIDNNNTLEIKTFDNQNGHQTRMAMTPDGLFGLGTTTPERTLDVAGTFRVELPTNTFTPIGSRFDVQTPGGRPGFFLRKGDGLGGLQHQYYWTIDNDNSLSISSNNASHNTERLTIDEDGNFGIGTTSPTTKLDINGAITIRGGADIVEGFQTANTDLVEPGTLMVIDPANPGKLMISTDAYDAKVAGIVSGANGVNPGIKLGQDGVMDGDLPIAMTGRVYVKCSTENGEIMPGDRLTTSSIPGHAMKATDSDRSDGAVIGKAMTSIDSETGMVLVLVNLQ